MKTPAHPVRGQASSKRRQLKLFQADRAGQAAHTKGACFCAASRMGRLVMSASQGWLTPASGTDSGLSAKSGGFCETPRGLATLAKVGFLVHLAEQATRVTGDEAVG